MEVRIINYHFSKEKCNQKAIHPLQSWQWGEARHEMGIKVLRIGEYSNKQIKNVYQITFHKVPYTKYQIGYLPRSKFPSKQVLEFLHSYGKKNDVIFIKLEPYVILSEAKNLVKRNYANARYLDSLTLARDDRGGRLKIVKSPHPLFPSWTQVIDINKSEEELLKSMHSKTRYNIRLAQKKGVVVKEMSTAAGFEIFAKLYFATCKRQKYFGHDNFYHKTLWHNLINKISHILIAFYQDTPLAVYQLFYFKDTLYYVYGGSSELHRNLMASNLLMWEAIKFAKKLGAQKFDVWGSLSPDYKQDHPWAGFTRFKEGYGGKFVEFVGSYDLIINPIAYKIYNSLFKIRSIYLQFRR